MSSGSPALWNDLPFPICLRAFSSEQRTVCFSQLPEVPLLPIMTLSPVAAFPSQNWLLLSECQPPPPSLPMHQERKAHMQVFNQVQA